MISWNSCLFYCAVLCMAQITSANSRPNPSPGEGSAARMRVERVFAEAEADLGTCQVRTLSGFCFQMLAAQSETTPTIDDDNFSSVEGDVNPAECSLKGSTNTCSTKPTGGQSTSCSVLERPGSSQPQTTARCSVLNPSQGTTSSGFCSVDASTSPGKHCSVSSKFDQANPSQCSVLSTGGNNRCSVNTGNEAGRKCSVEFESTPTSGPKCSVFEAGPNGDNTCSVLSTQVGQACTVTSQTVPAGDPVCSTHTGGAADLCSIIDLSTDPITVSGPVNGRCIPE